MSNLISVVMPCLNAGRYLQEAVDSVLGQQLPAPWQLELLLVDDGSRDPLTLELIDKARLDPRVRVLVNDKPGGVSRARNQAISVAQGTLIAFHDADDKWQADHLATHIRLLQDESVAFSATDYDYIDAEGQTIATDCLWSNRRKGPMLREKLGEGASAIFSKPTELFITMCPAWICALVVRRDALGSSRPFNEDLALAEDLELWIRLALNHNFAFGRATTAQYRKVGTSLTNSAGPSRLDMVTAKMYEGLAARPEFAAYVPLIRHTANTHHLSAAYGLKLLGKRLQSFACIANAVRCLPMDRRAYRQLLTLPLPTRQSATAATPT